MFNKEKAIITGIFVIYIISLYFFVVTNQFDLDFWLHLHYGKLFLTTGTIVTADDLLYSTVEKSFYIPPFGGVLYYTLLNWTNSNFLIYLTPLIKIFTFLYIVWIVREKLDNLLILTSLMIIAFSIHPLLGRPDLLVMPFQFWLVLRTLKPNQKYLLTFIEAIFIAFVWSFTHLSFIICLMISIGILFLIYFFRFINKIEYNTYRYYYCIFGSGIVIGNIPNLLYNLLYVRNAYMNTNTIRSLATEWAFPVLYGVNANVRFIQTFFIILSIFIVLLNLYKLKQDHFQSLIDMLALFICAIYLFLAFYALRFQWHYGVIFFCYALLYKNNHETNASYSPYIRYAYLVVLGLILLSTNGIEFSGKHLYPYEQVQFIQSHNLKGNCLTSQGEGALLSTSTYPNIKVLCDTRPDVSKNGILLLQNMFYNSQEVSKHVQEYDINFILFSKPDFLPGQLDFLGISDWILLFECENGSVWANPLYPLPNLSALPNENATVKRDDLWTQAKLYLENNLPNHAISILNKDLLDTQNITIEQRKIRFDLFVKLGYHRRIISDGLNILIYENNKRIEELVNQSADKYDYYLYNYYNNE